MSFANKFNKGQKIFDIDIKDFEFKKLSELKKGTKYKIDGLYLNTKSRFGTHPVAIIKDKKTLVDFPPHMTETVNEILTDVTAIEDIKSGKVGFEIEEYVAKDYNKTCYGCNFVDL